MKLKAGIIGLGVGEAHIKGYNDHPDCEVFALCDISGERCEELRLKYSNLRISKCEDDILKNSEIDIVSIASYDDAHYQQIVKAIEHDKHIFVEKPLCLYAKEAQHIRHLLNAKPHLRMSSNLILRKSPRFQAIKNKISAGEMGIPFHIEGDYNYGRLHKITEGWRGKIDFYSIVYGGGVHMVDLMLWLTNDKIVEVTAFGNNISSRSTQFRYNDMVVSILKFESGMTGKIAVNFGCVCPHFHNLAIYGTKATFVNGSPDGFLYESRDPEVDTQKISQAYPGVHKSDLICNFVDSIIHDKDSEVTKEDVLNAMSVCFSIEESVNTKKPVTVNYI